ncbi:MAG: sn-glycerol-3-phosphate ABC transporter substrate-binding protein, partial [Rhodobacteraceae bacterium]|nr:sn-glycerol-3-phosphate ABC transporter substrate-binding protein [Paracoccaceae bacterium]
MRMMTSAAALLLATATTVSAQTEIEFWHAFSGNNGEAVDELAAMFNESQSDYVLKPTYTGNYTEGTQKLTAAIAGNTAPGLAMLEVTRYGLCAARNV